MPLACILSTVLDLWERGRGDNSRQNRLETARSTSLHSDGYLAAGPPFTCDSALYILPPLLPPLLSPRAFFPFSRVELCLYPLSFSPPSFLNTGCWCHHPPEQRSPSFTSTARYSFSSISIFHLGRHGKPHLARVLPSCRYHCECL